jgi:hypothetical protein
MVAGRCGCRRSQPKERRDSGSSHRHSRYRRGDSSHRRRRRRLDAATTVATPETWTG